MEAAAAARALLQAAAEASLPEAVEEVSRAAATAAEVSPLEETADLARSHPAARAEAVVTEEETVEEVSLLLPRLCPPAQDLDWS